MRSLSFPLSLILVTAVVAAGCARQESPADNPADELDLRSAPAAAEAYIISPEDGESVESPVRVVFGLRGMGVAPAGTQVENTGHHHLLIDVDELPAMDQPMPNDEQHRHFGGGQTEAAIDLEPGTHTLQLVLGNLAHTPHDPPVVSEKITIEVVE